VAKKVKQLDKGDDSFGEDDASMSNEFKIGDTGKVPRSLVTKMNDLSKFESNEKDEEFNDDDWRPSYNSITGNGHVF
jgi:hypothetical protein